MLSAALAISLFIVGASPLNADRVSSGAASPHGSSSRSVRALWVARTTLTSPAAISAMVESAKQAGFNTILVQVRGRGDAYFKDGVEPRAVALARQSSAFDPLATTLKLAHEAGLQVHAWVNVNLVSDARGLVPHDHVVLRHPEWLMVPRELAGDLRRVSPSSDRYLDALRQWTRAHSKQVEGLYMSPLPGASVKHTVSVVTDLIDRYRVDGIHLDYLRYPNENFDYSAATLRAFHSDVSSRLSPKDRDRYDARLATNPFMYADAFPRAFSDFRRAGLTLLLSSIRKAMAARRPGLQLSAAVYPDPPTASARKFQDWQVWLAKGLIDVACPMAYAADAPRFLEQLQAARHGANGHPVWAGIGAYRLSAEQTVENIRTARRLGIDGIILFSYDSLVDSPAGRQPLSEIGRAAFEQ
ncbi:MAG: family 10 glycosylhydrolase [Acidobacteria bacterium]|nr:family 10 glycosylhydrolase [Acidobacteriota bacterium]